MLSSLLNRYCPLLIKCFSSYWSDIVRNLPNWRPMIECTPADFRVNCSESIQFSTDLFSLPLIYMIVMILYWQLWMLPASNMIAENVKRLRAVYLQLLISSDWYLKCVSEWSLITEWSRVKRHHPYQRVLCTRSFSMRKKQYIFMQVKLTLSPAGDWNKGVDRETLLQDWRDTEGVGQEGNGGGRTVWQLVPATFCYSFDVREISKKLFMYRVIQKNVP